MRLCIQHYPSYQSISDTVSVSGRYGVERSWLTIHNWIQKTELQQTDEKRPDHIVLDETVIQLDDQRYWPYAAVDPETNE